MVGKYHIGNNFNGMLIIRKCASYEYNIYKCVEFQNIHFKIYRYDTRNILFTLFHISAMIHDSNYFNLNLITLRDRIHEE